MEFSKKIGKVIDSGLTGLSLFIMGVMATMVVISVVLRYVFNITYVWSEELIIYLFVATTYFGSIICVKEKEHIDIPFLRELAPKTAGIIMDITVCLVNIIVQIGLAYLSFTWIEKTGSSLTTGMYIPLYVVYSIFPVCFILMAIYTFRRMENDIFSAIKESVHSRFMWIFANTVYLVIYMSALFGLGYLFFSIEWLEKIKTSLKPIMMRNILIVFSIMFAICAILVASYAIKKVKAIFEKDSLAKVGGKL